MSSRAKAFPLEALLALAGDLAQAWDAARVEMPLKKRIARTLFEEIIVDL